VKTCVGSEWCRFGTQDSTQMGKDLERALWRMYAPHKVKLAVSGLPAQLRRVRHQGRRRDRRGLRLGDLRGGNGGIKTEAAQFFCKVKTSEEVLEYSGAFLQLYREEGWYLERTVHYINRVGLDYVKKKILDDHAGRKALWERPAVLRWTGEPDSVVRTHKAQVDTRQFEKLTAVGQRHEGERTGR
jgi:nitrite reductase (NADH) large subunit